MATTGVCTLNSSLQKGTRKSVKNLAFCKSSHEIYIKVTEKSVSEKKAL
jgi:hypothetical protein